MKRYDALPPITRQDLNDIETTHNADVEILQTQIDDILAQPSAAYFVVIDATNYSTTVWQDDTTYYWVPGDYTLTTTLVIDAGTHFSQDLVTLRGSVIPLLQFGTPSSIYQRDCSVRFDCVGQGQLLIVDCVNVANCKLSYISVRGNGTTAFACTPNTGQRVSRVQFYRLQTSATYTICNDLNPLGTGFVTSNVYDGCRFFGGDQITTDIFKFGSATSASLVNEITVQNNVIEGHTNSVYTFLGGTFSCSFIANRIELQTGLGAWANPTKYNYSQAESGSHLIAEPYNDTATGAVIFDNLDARANLSPANPDALPGGVLLSTSKLRMYRSNTGAFQPANPVAHFQRSHPNSITDLTSIDNPVVRIDDVDVGPGANDCLHLRVGNLTESSTRFLTCATRNALGLTGEVRFIVNGSGTVQTLEGSTAQPAYSFISNPTTGFYNDLDGVTTTVSGQDVLKISPDLSYVNTERFTVAKPGEALINSTDDIIASFQDRVTGGQDNVTTEYLHAGSSANQGGRISLNVNDFRFSNRQGGDILFQTVSTEGVPGTTSTKFRITPGSISGSTASTGAQLLSLNTTVNNPSYSFAADQNSGFYRKNGGQIAIAKDGVDVWSFNATTFHTFSGTIAIDGLDMVTNINTGVPNAITLSGSTNFSKYLRVRHGGNPQGRTGIIFSYFDTHNYFAEARNGGNLEFGYRAADIDAHPASTILSLTPTGALNCTGNLSCGGSFEPQGVIRTNDGTAASNAYSFQNSFNSGIFFEDVSGTVNICAAASVGISVGDNGIVSSTRLLHDNTYIKSSSATLGAVLATPAGDGLVNWVQPYTIYALPAPTVSGFTQALNFEGNIKGYNVGSEAGIRFEFHMTCDVTFDNVISSNIEFDVASIISPLTSIQYTTVHGILVFDPAFNVVSQDAGTNLNLLVQHNNALAGLTSKLQTNGVFYATS